MVEATIHSLPPDRNLALQEQEGDYRTNGQTEDQPDQDLLLDQILCGGSTSPARGSLAAACRLAELVCEEFSEHCCAILSEYDQDDQTYLRRRKPCIRQIVQI